MAMTKKEKEAHARELRELKLLAAIRWTDVVLPDVPPPEGGSGRLTKGWTYNVYNQEVEPGCSSFISHGIGRTDKTNIQRPISLYSTRLLALRALRADFERMMAVKLVLIDTMIADELATQEGKE